MNTEVEGIKMQFRTDVLKAAVESAIAESEKLHNRMANVDRATYERKAQEHAETHNPSWETALPKIRRAIRANKPITIDMIPARRSGWRGEAEVFSETPPKDRDFVVPQDLRVMRNALRLITDETVTTTALRQLGVSASMIRTVCELAREEATKQLAKPSPAKLKQAGTVIVDNRL